MWWIIGTIVVCVVIILTLSDNSEVEKLGKEYIADVNAEYLDGVPGLTKNFNVKIQFFRDKVIIKEEFLIPTENILQIRAKKDSELSDSDKSVIGRGILGTLIAGVPGAIVGSASALKDGGMGANKILLFFEYKNKDNENVVASFVANYNKENWDNLFLSTNIIDAIINLNKPKENNKILKQI